MSSEQYEVSRSGLYVPVPTICDNCPRLRKVRQAEEVVQENPNKAFSPRAQQYKLSQLALEGACITKIAVGCPGADKDDCPRERDIDELQRLVMEPITPALEELPSNPIGFRV